MGRGATAQCSRQRQPRSRRNNTSTPGHVHRRVLNFPSDFTYVFHAAVDPGADDWQRCLKTNAHNSGDLLYHCRAAKGFVLCSTGSIYGYHGRRPLIEPDAPGVPLRANYSFSKIAAESVCSWISEQFGIPLTIIRICSTYGPRGGAPPTGSR